MLSQSNGWCLGVSGVTNSRHYGCLFNLIAIVFELLDLVVIFSFVSNLFSYERKKNERDVASLCINWCI